MRQVRKSGAALVLAGALGLGQMAMAGPGDTSKTVQESTTTSDKTVVTPPVDAAVNADNTKRNTRDRLDTEVTADNQKNNKSDMEITREIRRAVIKDKTLSTYAHNVKIVAQAGTVTLKGPVHSEAEKANVEQKAAATVGEANVKSQIEVKP